MSRLRFILVLLFAAVAAVRAEERVKRQTADAETTVDEDAVDAFTKELCATKGAQEYFRLSTQDCRKVIQCTEVGLESLVCPPSLAFDLELQACNWKEEVKNCGKTTKDKKVRPLTSTKDPLCEGGKLACGDGTCLPREVFCDGNPDCNDFSDENFCDINSDPNRAPQCDKAECQLPSCFCINNPSETPNNIDPKDVPQMIMITFDDAVNNNNVDLYDLIFSGRSNPNGCDIKATFFVSHKYTNYSAVSELHRKGHEIAVHSISHNDSATFWTEATVQDWTSEMAGARQIVNRFANITDTTVVGVRAPYLRVGGNNQFLMMEEQGFLYDSTIVAPLADVPLWPYTLYYRMPHECHGHIQVCPTRAYAVWEMVMNEMDRREDPAHEEPLPGCAMVDSCFSNKPTGDQFYTFLTNNFNRHYNTNRAPMGLFFHSAFIKNNAEVLDAFLFWLDEILTNHNDVYFVTMTQGLYWLQDIVPISQIANFEPWKDKCAVQGPPACLNGGNNCKLDTSELPGETVRLSTCMSCPNKYPWLLDPNGDGLF
ncbi:Low-density lipoprotein (LDL) receptor class A repeat [Trinorchestia longiramus]|nr:Low-density lipoprotein (LDL) receptor class A repeat [Trinorchestia longiramus]